MIIGIDATNLRLGGGVTHLKEILNYFESEDDEVIVFGGESTLEQLPIKNNITKVSHLFLNRHLIYRIYYQLFIFTNKIREYQSDILYSPGGDYFGSFKPQVSMARNMLLYDREAWKDIGFGKEVIKFYINYFKQKRSFLRSQGIIFISNYSKGFINKKLNIQKKKQLIIHHGVSTRFSSPVKEQQSLSFYSTTNRFKLLYVSTVHEYKHQWNVVEAVGTLIKNGFPIELDMVGDTIFKKSGEKLYRALDKFEDHKKHIRYHKHVPYETIEKYYKEADGIIFASTCETMPNILIESMASGTPILCSDKEPMPEFLKGNGFYFDATSVESLKATIVDFLNNPKERYTHAVKAKKEVEQYNWQHTSTQTFKFIKQVYRDYKLIKP